MPVSKPASEFSSLLDGFHKTPDGYRAKCPAHNGDNDTSLHIWENGSDTYLKCFAHNCRLKDILKAIGLEVPKIYNGNEESYNYVDESGNLLSRAVRYYWHGEKRFKQQQPDPANTGKFLDNIQGVRKVVYRLPQIIKAIEEKRTILIVEGEKDVHTAERMGFAATTNAGGGGKNKWKNEHSQCLIGAHVVIIPDDDEEGEAHEKTIIRELSGYAASIKVVRLPSYERGFDLTDWVGTGGTREQLESLISNARDISESLTHSQEDDEGYTHEEGRGEGGRPIVWDNPTDVTTPIDQCIQLIIESNSPIYQRDGRIVTIKRYKNKHGSIDSTIYEAPIKCIQETLTRLADFMVPTQFKNKKQYYKPGGCSERLATHIKDRVEIDLLPLDGIVTTPTLRPDGSIITAPGYDEETCLIYLPTRDYPNINENPSKDDALLSLNTLQDVFCDFPFSENYHKSAAIGAILTIMSRHLVNNVPLHAITSNVAGSGKTLLLNIISIIATGKYPHMAVNGNHEEMQKSLLAIAMDGSLVTAFDNVVGKFGSQAMDMAITSDRISGRILGKSEIINHRIKTCFFITGNNIRYLGDMSRRIMPIVLSPESQNPEERTEFKCGRLREWVYQNQPQLMAHALTILTAYIQAGKPRQEISNYGSFEDWSDLVRGSLVWLGADDPRSDVEQIKDNSDEDFDSLRTLLTTWSERYSGKLIDPQNPNDPEKNGLHMKDIVSEVKTAFKDDIKGVPGGDKALALGDSLLFYDPKARGRISDLSAHRLSMNMPVNNQKSRVIDGMRLVYVLLPNKTKKWLVTHDKTDEMPVMEDRIKDSVDDYDDPLDYHDGPDDDLPF